jgi:multimeric flavodoxin WrbA
MKFMQIAIVYHSQSGHTARQAQAVAEGVGLHGRAQAVLVDVARAPIPWDVLGRSQALIFGCPTFMGAPSAVFKKFMEDSAALWRRQEWADKIAAGFTNSASQSGDKLNTLVSLALFAAQHGMLWASLGLMPGNNKSTASVNDLNRLGTWLGAMAQSNADQPAELAPIDSDLATARHLGLRVATVAERFAAAAA